VPTEVSYDPAPNVRTSSRAERKIVAIGGATAALYIVNWLVERAIHDNGMTNPCCGYAASGSGMAWQMALYLLVTACLFTAYASVLAMCRRGELAAGRAKTWSLIVPCVLNLGLAATTPQLSQDIFSYMAHGFLGTIPGHNPLTDVAQAARYTAFGPNLAAAGWHTEPGISPYGIIWTQIEVNIMKLSGTNVTVALFLMKAVVLAATFGTAYAIWSFLGQVSPAAQLPGTLAYLWNPLILVEFAGEGHNDAVMVLFAIAALASCASRRPALSIFMQLCGILSKYVSVLFVPAQLVYLWRTRQTAGRLALQILAAVLVAAAIAALLYAPLWAGAHTFDGILRRGTPISSAAPFGAINWILRRSPLSGAAGPLTIAAVTLPVLGFIAWISLRVKNAAGLALAFAWISVAYVLIASPDFWPWYACMPIALLITADSERFLWLIILLSVSARLGAPLELLRDHGFLTMQWAKGALTGMGTTLPLAALLVWVLWQRKRPATSAL
jgi:alpha-1,6-mannosyltransferase